MCKQRDPRRVQWKQAMRSHQGSEDWTVVHRCDPTVQSTSKGTARTLCGKTFAPQTADFDDRARGRECDKCTRAARQWPVYPQKEGVR